MCICMSFRSAVGHGEASGAHNGVTLITEQQEPQQCEEQDTIVPVDLRHLPNEEDSCPSETVRAKQLDTPTKALSFVDKDYFPNIYVILVISATLPVTSCECERSISMLKLLKTSLRSTMGNDRLNGLALMLIHRDVELNPDAVAEESSRRYPRRLLLITPFSE